MGQAFDRQDASSRSLGNSPQVSAEMPRYRCHKEVWALKIKSIDDPNQATDGSRLLSFTDDRYAPIGVARDFMQRHRPEVGGYYVVYKDGYKSYSPADAFEDGYTRI